jgi:hypothetical protein
MIWCLGATAIWYGGRRCYSVPTAVSHDVCEQYPHAIAYGVGSFKKMISSLYELGWR